MTPWKDGGGRDALVAGAACYALWGLSPLIYQPMAHAGADAWEIMAHRALWGSAWAAGLVALTHGAGEVRRVLAEPRTLGLLLLSTLMIAVNWGLFIWSVNTGRTLETSLGYYLNPLLNMALGAWLFRERLGRLGWISVGLAAVGVAVQGLALGHLPYVSVVLAVTFAAYGLIRKQVRADASTGLVFECLFMLPFGLAWLVWIETHGAGHFGHGAATSGLLLLCGPVTVAPLVLFSWAARRLPLSTIGFLQFIAPTISFVIGVTQGEAFTAVRGLSFGFIWAGAAMFVISAWHRGRAARCAVAASDGPGA